MKHVATLAGAAIVSLGLASAAKAEEYTLTLCGASLGGLWSLVGAGVDAAVKESFPGSTITYQTSSGGLANVVQVKRDVCDMGIANDGDLIYAVNGREPFDEKIEGLTALSVLYDWAPVMWIAREDWAEEHGIEDIGDLAEKQVPVRLVFNRRGLLTSAITEATLEALGVSLEDIEEWGGSVQFQASNEQAELMQNGRVDLLANTLFEGHRTITAMSQAVDLKMLSVPQEAIDATIEEFQLKPWTIEAGTHDWQENDGVTVTTSIILFVDESMDEETAYNIVKSMIEHPDQMAAVSNAMKRFEPSIMTDQSAIPFHPGAIKAYEEAGLM